MEFVDDKQEDEAKSRGTRHLYGFQTHKGDDEDKNTKSDLTFFNQILNTIRRCLSSVLPTAARFTTAFLYQKLQKTEN